MQKSDRLIPKGPADSIPSQERNHIASAWLGQPMYDGITEALRAAGLQLNGAVPAARVRDLAQQYTLSINSGFADEPAMFSRFVSELVSSGAFDPVARVAVPRKRALRPKGKEELLDRDVIVRSVESVAQWFAAKYTPSVNLHGFRGTVGLLIYSVAVSARETAKRSGEDRRDQLASAVRAALEAAHPWEPMYRGILTTLERSEFSVIGVAQRQRLKSIAIEYTGAHRHGVLDPISFLAEFAADLITTGALEPHVSPDNSSHGGTSTHGMTPVERHGLLRTAERVTRWFAAEYTPAVPVPAFHEPLARFVEAALEDSDEFQVLFSREIRERVIAAITTVLSGGAVDTALEDISDGERDQAWLQALRTRHLGVSTDCEERGPRPVGPQSGSVEPEQDARSRRFAAIALAHPAVWLPFLDEVADYAERTARCRAALGFSLGEIGDAAEAAAPLPEMAARLLQLCAEYEGVVINFIVGIDSLYLRRRLASMLAEAAKD